MGNLVDLRVEVHRYGTIEAVNDCCLSIQQNAMVAVIGPNGGGKSTLLKLIAGLFPPTQGFVFHHNLNPTDIAYLAQSTEIDRTFPIKVEDVVAMGLWPHTGIFRGIPPDERSRVAQILDHVGLKGFEHRSLSELSGGQVQRMLFARVMAQNAQLILLDEPFAGIDQPTVAHLLMLIQEWQAQGKTIIAVLHDIPIVRRLFPHTVLIAHSLVAFDRTEKVLTLENLTKATFNV